MSTVTWKDLLTRRVERDECWTLERQVPVAVLERRAG